MMQMQNGSLAQFLESIQQRRSLDMQGKLQSFLPYLDHLQQQNKIKSEQKQRRDTVLNDTINLGKSSGWTDEDVQNFTTQSEGLSEAAIPTLYNSFQTDTAARTSLAGSNINLEGMNPLKLRMISEVYNNLSQYGPEVLAMFAEKVNAGADPRAAMAEILPQAQAGMASKTESAAVSREAGAQRKLLEQQGVPAEKLAVYDELLPYMTASTLPMLSRLVTEDPAAAGRNAITSYRNLIETMGMGAEALAEYDAAAAGVTPDLLPKLVTGLADKYQTISDARARGLDTSGTTAELKSRIERFDSRRTGSGTGRSGSRTPEPDPVTRGKIESTGDADYVYYRGLNTNRIVKSEVYTNANGRVCYAGTNDPVNWDHMIEYGSIPNREDIPTVQTRTRRQSADIPGVVWE